MFSTYVTALDPGLIGRQENSPPKFPHRSIGRPHTEQVTEGKNIRIEWPRVKHGRVRKIITRSGSRRRYAIPCFRGGDRIAHGESAEENNAIIMLDACANIVFQEQPACICFEWNGEEVEHFPDLIVAADNTKEFWECKSDHEVLDLYVRRRSERLAELLSPIGYGYRLVSTSQLLAGSYLENAIRMRRRAKLFVPSVATRQIDLRASAATLSKATDVLGDISISDQIELLYTLLYRGELSGNLRQPITLKMDVGPPRARGKLPWVWELFEKSN